MITFQLVTCANRLWCMQCNLFLVVIREQAWAIWWRMRRKKTFETNEFMRRKKKLRMNLCELFFCCDSVLRRKKCDGKPPQWKDHSERHNGSEEIRGKINKVQIDWSRITAPSLLFVFYNWNSNNVVRWLVFMLENSLRENFPRFSQDFLLPTGRWEKITSTCQIFHARRENFP